MDTNTTGYWNITKEKLKQKYQILSEKDVQFNEGKEREMIEMIGKKLGKILNLRLALIAKNAGKI